MSEPYLSELKIFSFSFAPRGWAQCNGQLLPINQNQALFSLLGTTYGGDGRVNFALPNLRGRTPMCEGGGFTLGQTGGETAHTINMNEMPAHNHFAQGSSNVPDNPSPANTFWPSNSGLTLYGPNHDKAMAPDALTNFGGSQAHNNMSPYLVLNICIALVGIFPSRN